MTVNFDNAATTFPKPPEVRLAVEKALVRYGSSGRGSHPIDVRGSELIYSARETIAEFFGAEPENVVLTANCTRFKHCSSRHHETGRSCNYQQFRA